jgi:hypothetical protein
LVVFDFPDVEEPFECVGGGAGIVLEVAGLLLLGFGLLSLMIRLGYLIGMGCRE